MHYIIMKFHRKNALREVTPGMPGVTYAYSLSRDAPYLGKTDGPFYELCRIISTPPP